MEDWKKRERGRFKDGTYKPVPVTFDGTLETDDHFLHLSKQGGDMVAYTPGDLYGKADRQVPIKFGKYLKKFTNMSDEDIKNLVTKFRAALGLSSSSLVLNFATDVETINRIFETPMYSRGGIDVSCMYGKFSSREVRPYHVYANSTDVAVAYATQDGDIVSRSVVNTKRKEWVRAYSSVSGSNETECEMLVELLGEAGYTEGDLIGCKLTKLPTKKVMLPYIDWSGMYVVNKGDHWLVVDEDDKADYRACNTDGTAQEVESGDDTDYHDDDDDDDEDEDEDEEVLDVEEEQEQEAGPVFLANQANNLYSYIDAFVRWVSSGNAPRGVF